MNLIKVPVKIVGEKGYVEVEMIVDTGSVRSAIHKSIADRIGIKKISDYKVADATGNIVTGYLGKAIIILGNIATEVELFVSDSIKYNILGCSTLEALGLGIDVSRDKLIKISDPSKEIHNSYGDEELSFIASGIEILDDNGKPMAVEEVIEWLNKQYKQRFLDVRCENNAT